MSVAVVSAPAKASISPFENIDRLLNVEIRIAKSPADAVPKLYRLVRRELPLSYEVSQALLGKPRCRIAFVTGVVNPHFPVGEIDGPIGGLVFARAMHSLGYKVSLVMEKAVIESSRKLVATARAEGIEFIDGDALDAAGVQELVEKFDMAIASEKVGLNGKGVRHSINGTPVNETESFPWPDEFIVAMNRAAKLTIGFGDGGNEIGFGKVYREARDIVPNGKSCRCRCADGIVTRTATQLLFPVNVSNFGVYGLVAAVAIALRQKELVHDEQTEAALLREAVNAGIRDGGTGLLEPAEDGVPAYGAVGLVAMLRALVENALRDFVRPF
jgi:hypothetical protein